MNNVGPNILIEENKINLNEMKNSDHFLSHDGISRLESTFLSSQIVNHSEKNKIENGEKINSIQLKDCFNMNHNCLNSFLENFLKNRQNNIKAIHDHGEDDYSNPKLCYSSNLIFNSSKKIYNLNCSLQIGRVKLIKNEQIFQNICQKAIFFQKYSKAYLTRHKFFNLDEIDIKTVGLIIKLESNIRRFLTVKKLRLMVILNHITTNRKLNIIKIKNFLLKMKRVNQIKKKLIISQILKERNYHIKKLQNALKRYLIHKKVHNLILKEKKCHILTYPFIAVKVQLIIYVNNSYVSEEKRYNFEFCKLRDMFYLYIDRNEFKPGMYRVKLIADNIIKCYRRFPYIEFSDGYFYNVIDFTHKRKTSIESLDMNKKTNAHSSSGEEDFDSERSYSMVDGSLEISIISYDPSYSFFEEIREDKFIFELDLNNELKKCLGRKYSHSYIEFLKDSDVSSVFDFFEN